MQRNLALSWSIVKRNYFHCHGYDREGMESFCDMLCESLGAFCVDVTSLYQGVKSVHENSVQGCNSHINLYEHETLIKFVIVPLRHRY
jgi:hypothetical protein